jgi:hypothetical protein
MKTNTGGKTMDWWKNRLLVISAVQCNYGEDSFEILRKHTAGRYFNTEQLFHLTADKTRSWAYFKEKEDGEKLDNYLRESSRLGIREIFYLNTHTVPQAVRDMHPEWVQLDKNGNEIKAYDVDYLVCVNSGWYDEYAQTIRELCSHNIDGIFSDGPVVSREGCFCDACQDKFRERYGTELREATDEQRMQFNVESVTEFVRKTRDIIKAEKPDILLYLNNSALRADVTGSNTRKVEPYVDVLGAEGGFIWVNKDTPLWHVSPMAKQIEAQANGKPTVIFIAGDYKPWSYYMHTACETNIYYAQALANGANVWYGIHGSTDHMDTPGGAAAVRFNKFLRDNEEIYVNTEPCARVALMWSQDTANYYSSSVMETDFTNKGFAGTKNGLRGDHYKSFYGFYEILMRGHVQHNIVDEISVLNGDLENYDLLILPTCACISDDVAEKICEFVHNGGRLISDFDTGLYNEKGKMRGLSKLAQLQGIRGIKGFVEYKPGHGYQRHSDSFISSGLSWKYIPSPELALRVVPSDSAEVLAEYSEPMEGRYMPPPENFYPGVLYNRIGKGQSIYFAGTFGEFFNKYTNPDYKRMLLNAVYRFADPLVITDAPGSVEIVLRRQDDRYILHLINMTGEMERPIQRIMPIYNIKTEVNLHRPASCIRSITGQTPADFETHEKGCRFTVPEIKEYEVFVIDTIDTSQL